MTAASRSMLAASLGAAEPGEGCRCVLCGDSRYSPFGARSKLGHNFVDFDLLADGGAPDLCAGCRSLLAGRPGRTPPPLRMTSLWADGQSLVPLKTSGLWRYLSDPPEGEWVLSWATSGKVHHWLRAGVSTPERMEVGSDSGTIVYQPHHDRRLLSAVHALLHSPTGTAPLLPRRSIVRGDYHPSAVQRFGADRWQRLESVVAGWRPSLLLDLVAASAPLSERDSAEEDHVIDEKDTIAAELLAAVVQRCDARARDGKAFWGGFLRHRITRFRALPLHDCVSRLMAECGTSTVSSGQVVEILADLDPDEVSAVEGSLRGRTDLVIALTYQLTRRAM